jgi:nicotinate (nicotinamide) nucleotide adenylyltransferase/ribosome silencing factor RsfS/YbeB/iojap
MRVASEVPAKANSPPHPNPLPRWGRGSLYGTVAGRRIGLLGGSFNPAHAGHMHITREALKRLNLDEVWWLVSPQNPLKPVAGMAPFAERLAQAAAVAAADPRIRVTDIEAKLGTTYTADNLKMLRRRFSRAHFVWLMGGDNLAQIPYWKRWQDIFRTVPVAVFARPTTSLKALAGRAAHRFAGRRVPEACARRLAMLPPPAWVFFHTRLDPRSATRIRAERTLSFLKEKRTQVTPELAAIATISPRPRRTADPAQLLRQVIDSLEDGKAEDIVTIDLAGKTTFADYMVVASGRSARQVVSLTEHLEKDLAGHVAVEGKSQGDWVLIDAGDVVVHIFRPEIRAYYNLEKMWGAGLPEAETAVQ